MEAKINLVPCYLCPLPPIRLHFNEASILSAEKICSLDSVSYDVFDPGSWLLLVPGRGGQENRFLELLVLVGAVTDPGFSRRSFLVKLLEGCMLAPS